ncbi:MAG: hypothetical protein IJM53_09095 [Lachnospiraceae bacterium]|nr:hypothetical protein [Lachnospiraceae bacterium]
MIKEALVIISLGLAADYDIKDRAIPAWVILIFWAGMFIIPEKFYIVEAVITFIALSVIRAAAGRIFKEETLGEGDMYLFSLIAAGFGTEMFLKAVFLALIMALFPLFMFRRVPLAPCMLTGAVGALASYIIIPN